MFFTVDIPFLCLLSFEPYHCVLPTQNFFKLKNFLVFILFIYLFLAASDLSCGMQALRCGVQASL